MLKQTEGSVAVAEAIAMCRPEVICAYQPRQPHRFMAHADAGLCRPITAMQYRVPGWRGYTGLVDARRRGRLRDRLARAGPRQPAPWRHGAGLLSPLRRRLQPGTVGRGRWQPTGEFEELEADTLILALGQDVDTSFLERVSGVDIAKDGVVEVDANMMTGRPGLFAGGDMVPAERTGTVAVGHGKKAARHIDAYLRGETYVPPKKHDPATFDRLNAWYYDDAPPTVQPALEAVRRQSGFDEVLQGLDEDSALYEARRCLSCGNCFECDNCYGICPDNAVIKLGSGNRFQFNYDYCKGCGMCAEECPCGAIDMVAEAK